MQRLRLTLCVLALTSPLAGCFSYSSHEEGYSRPYGAYDQSYSAPYYSNPYYSSHPRYYDNRNDED